MRDDRASFPTRHCRGPAQSGVTAFTLIALVGCGGGSGDTGPQCSYFSDVCNPVIEAPPVAPAAAAFPLKLVVQAGGAARFTGEIRGIDRPVYQWRRSVDGGMSYVDIPNATAASIALPRAELTDDGSMFRLDVGREGGTTALASTNPVTLLVSSLPAVGYADGDFQAADWHPTDIAEPALNGPTHREDRSATGGLPDAYRHMVHALTAGPSSLRVFNTKVSAIYDPRVLGAIHAIDYREDCNRVAASASGFDVLSFAAVEQAGRRYVSSHGRGCLSSWINNFAQVPTLQATDFEQVDGPACGGGESCPDFSASGAPLRFGFERRVSRRAGAPAGSIEHGIDNWTFSVWRP